jgi:hypothetical protein
MCQCELLGVQALRSPRAAAVMARAKEDARTMNDFHRGLLLGALGGFVIGAGVTYAVVGWWVTRLLRQLAADTKRLVDRTSRPE